MEHKTDQPIEPRVEDDYLVRGNGRFIADAAEPDQTAAAFVRSPHAHARIRGIDWRPRRKVRGRHRDRDRRGVDAAGVGSVTRHPPLPGRNGGKLVMPHRHALARERVMYVGETGRDGGRRDRFAAQDAADLVEVDYEPLDPVVDACEATQRPARRSCGRKRPAILRSTGPAPIPIPMRTPREVERIMASAKHVARVKVTQQRLTHATMEPRGATAQLRPANDSYQAAGLLAERGRHARPRHRGHEHPEGEAARHHRGRRRRVRHEDRRLSRIHRPARRRKITKRPVHWMATRSESFLNDAHARDTVTEAELALDDNGRFLALRVRHFANWAPMSARSAPTCRR